MERRDVIIVATVSCIYGLGMPDLYKEMRIHVEKGNELDTQEIASRLISIQYERNDMILERGKFRIKGDTIEIFPPYMETDEAYKIELDFDQISRIKRFNAISGETIEELDELQLYPAKHFVVPRDQMASVTEKIQTELDSRLEELRCRNSWIP